MKTEEREEAEEAGLQSTDPRSKASPSFEVRKQTDGE